MNFCSENMPLQKIWNEFAEEVSMHGVKKVQNQQTGLVRRYELHNNYL